MTFLEKQQFKKRNFKWTVIDKEQVLDYLVKNNYFSIEVIEVDPVYEFAIIKDTDRDIQFKLKLVVKNNKIINHKLI